MTSINKNIKDLIKHDKTIGEYKLYNLDSLNDNDIDFDIIITHSSYNDEINESLLNGYLNALGNNNFHGNIAEIKIPGGAFELPLCTEKIITKYKPCLLYTSPSPRDRTRSRMPSSA